MYKEGRVLVIGDSHLKISKLEDARSFINQLKKQVFERPYSHVILLGDQFDTFSVIRSEIMSLWNDFVDFLNEFNTNPKLIMLVGNHDYAGHNGGTHSLETFKGRAIVVDKMFTQQINNVNVCFLPFIRDKVEFENLCKDIPEGSVLFCHQSFDGAKFENGFYDPDGVNIDCVKHLSKVIVGHIHTAASIGENIYYVGSPFQQSFGEAGHKKAIVYMNIGQESMQKCQSEKFIELDMPKYEELELSELNPKLLPNPLPTYSYKIRSSGTPQEIALFKSSEQFKNLKEVSRRVVDDISIIRENKEYSLESKNKTTEEKIVDFINKKNWKSNKEDVLGRARSYLSK